MVEIGLSEKGTMLTEAQKGHLDDARLKYHQVKHYFFQAIDRTVFEQILVTFSRQLIVLSLNKSWIVAQPRLFGTQWIVKHYLFQANDHIVFKQILVNSSRQLIIGVYTQPGNSRIQPDPTRNVRVGLGCVEFWVWVGSIFFNPIWFGLGSGTKRKWLGQPGPTQKYKKKKIKAERRNVKAQSTILSSLWPKPKSDTSKPNNYYGSERKFSLPPCYSISCRHPPSAFWVPRGKCLPLSCRGKWTVILNQVILNLSIALSTKSILLSPYRALNFSTKSILLSPYLSLYSQSFLPLNSTSTLKLKKSTSPSTSLSLVIPYSHSFSPSLSTIQNSLSLSHTLTSLSFSLFLYFTATPKYNPSVKI